MSDHTNSENLILGLDLGSNSIGWALVEAPRGKPRRVVKAGVRAFDAGVNLNEKGEKGSKNFDRRMARGRRRLLHRRRRRMDKTLHELQRGGWLPKGELKDNAAAADADWEALLRLDPYELRSRALDVKLEPYEFGRAIYHLAKRRGFQSNRKSEPKKEEEEGIVNRAVGEIEEEMQATGARTYGEFLSKIDPHERRRRGPGRYTHRRWYVQEFDAIWKAQSAYYPEKLNDQYRKALEQAIFHQRPLKNQSHLIGRCELESRNGKGRAPKGRFRAPRASLPAQRQRLLEMVNHALLESPGGESLALSPEQRALLIETLEREGDLSMAKARRLLEVPRGWHFNHERGGKKAFFGNRTAAKLREIFSPERWDVMDEVEREQAVEDVLTFEKRDALERRAARPFIREDRKIRGWGLEPEAARALAALKPEPDFSRYSRQALEKLLPHLEDGMSHTEALNAAYPHRETAVRPLDVLPPLGDIRNPIVQRTLAELRRVVNSIIRRYGKPNLIRIELSRDLKNPRRVREQIQSDINTRENERKKAAASVTEITGNPRPPREDIEKLLLWQECNQQCPYTGRMISQQDLLGDPPQVDFEHIIPFSRSLDNSFANKTLAFVGANRERKGNRTPWEAYGPIEGDERALQEWEDIIIRVKQFRPKYRAAKLRRFLATNVELEEEFFANFTNRQLNDTRYASRRAAEYVAQLYGAAWRKHVQVNQGRATAFLRGVWQLNGILNSDGIKTRDDHRHHAVDAVCVALSSPTTVRSLAEASKRGRTPGRFGEVALPWKGFVEEVRDHIFAIVVSHRVSRKVNGPLHKDTHYGMIKPHRGAPEPIAVLRKPVASLTDAEIRRRGIVDLAVRRAVMDKLDELGGDIRAFKRTENHPILPGRSGRSTPIHTVRVYQQVSPERIAGGSRERFVQLGGNHHLAIYEAEDREGHLVWKGEVVSRLEAAKRSRRRDPIVRSMNGEGKRLLFSLVIGEAVELEWKGERLLAIVQNLSGTPHPYYVFTRISDSRASKARRSEEIRFQSDRSFQRSGCRKVAITPLGEVRTWSG